MDPAQYNPIPFDHTYILYDPTDIISVVSVQFSLLPIYIMVFYTAWFLITREIEPVAVVGGHLLNEVFNKIAKLLLKHPRPDFHKDFGSNSSYGLSYGMPSAHSQFMGYFAAYFICTIIVRVRHLRPISKIFGSIVLVIAAILVASSRVYLFYHNVPQVVVGVVLGSVVGLAHFILASVLRDVGIVDWVLSWPIVKYFHVKDSYYHCYQTFEQEYNSYITRRMSTKQKPI